MDHKSLVSLLSIVFSGISLFLYYTEKDPNKKNESLYSFLGVINS